MQDADASAIRAVIAAQFRGLDCTRPADWAAFRATFLPTPRLFQRRVTPLANAITIEMSQIAHGHA